MSEANGGKVENFNGTKDKNRRLALEEAEVQRIGRSIMRICKI